MPLNQFAAWGVIAALSLMLIGGLVLWAYGARVPHGALVPVGPEAEATHRFHQKLVRWFLVYGAVMLAAGIGLLLWSGTYFLKN